MGSILPMLLLLNSCGGGPSLGIESLDLVEGEEAISFGPADTTYVDNSYRLSPGDELELIFLFDTSLNAKILVRPDGGINLPIIGDITVAGRKPGELATQIAEAYSRYYANPQLSINLTKYAPPQCYVMGDVRYPQAVPIRPGMTMLGAIASVGGPTEVGSLGNAILIRRIASNKAMARHVDLSKFAHGKAVSSDLFVQDYDIIYVPRTFLGKLTTAAEQVFSPLTSMPVFYLRGWEAFHTDRVYNRVIRPSEVTPAEKP